MCVVLSGMVIRRGSALFQTAKIGGAGGEPLCLNKRSRLLNSPVPRLDKSGGDNFPNQLQGSRVQHCTRDEETIHFLRRDYSETAWVIRHHLPRLLHRPPW